jgi:hypothetical protein
MTAARRPAGSAPLTEHALYQLDGWWRAAN